MALLLRRGLLAKKSAVQLRARCGCFSAVRAMRVSRSGALGFVQLSVGVLDAKIASKLSKKRRTVCSANSSLSDGVYM